jgi:hypothetical protein
MFHELLSRDHEDGRATWQSRGTRDTSQEPTPEDARKDGHIVRARCAPLSPASGFPVSWSQQVIHEISGLKILPEVIPKSLFQPDFFHAQPNT